MQYQTASEVEYTHWLFSQPIPIVAACNRLRMAQVREKGNAWCKGVFWGVAVALAIALVAA
jgi:hypothetical protein